MSKRTDLTHLKVGGLTVTSYAFSRKGNTYWNCDCSYCGGECQQPKSALIAKPPTVKSCGCQKEDYIEKGKWGAIYRVRHVFLSPWAYFPKSKQQGLKQPPFWLCRCFGKVPGCIGWVEASTTALKTGKAISCTVCAKKAEAHQIRQWEDELQDEAINKTQSKKDTRVSYDCMIGRPKHSKTYQHKKVCEQWQGAGGYEQFVKDMGLRRHRGLTLERLDLDKGYEPGNCVWTTDAEQRRNKSSSRKLNVGGEQMNLVDFAAVLCLKVNLASRRIATLMKSGLSEDEAVEILWADHKMSS